MSPKFIRFRYLAMAVVSLALLACGIVFQSTTVVNEDESNTTTLTVAIDKSLLVDTTTVGRWEQQLATITTYLEERGAKVQRYEDEQYRGLKATITFADLTALNAQQSGDALSLFSNFKLQRWRGEFVFEARTTSAFIRERILQITGLNEDQLLLVQFPLNISLKLPGTFLSSNADLRESDGTQTWAVNWLEDKEHVFYADSRVPLIPPVITAPTAGTRIRDASQGVDFSGTGEPGADLRLFRIQEDKQTLLGRGQVGPDRRWSLSAVKLAEVGEYSLQVEEATDHESSVSSQTAVDYRPLETIVFVPGYYACSEGILPIQVNWHWGLWPSDDPGWATTGLLPTVSNDYYGPLFRYFIAQGYVLNKNLFVACYNWSASLPAEAAKLQEVLDWAIAESPGPRRPMTVITHSNGGLIARYAVQSDPLRTVNQISDLIMLAPPNHGVAKSYYAWEGGDLSHESEPIRTLVMWAFGNKCGIWPWQTNNMEYQKKIYDCVRFGKMISPVPYELATARNHDIVSLAWLLPGWEFLQDGANLRTYPDAPIRRLNTPEQIQRLFRGLQRNVYVLEGDIGASTLAVIPVKPRLESDNPLWKNGKPDTSRTVTKHQGDDSILIDSASLPEAASFPGRYHLYPPYPGASHTEGMIKSPQVLADIGKIIRETLPGERETEHAESDFLIVWVESPVNLLVTDKQGRQTGVDAAGQMIGEIPEAAYGDTADPLGPKFVIIPNPVAGDYRFDITGMADGHYAINGLSTASNQPVIAQAGQIAMGQKKTYTAKYSPPSETAAPSRRPIIVLLAALAGGGALAVLVLLRRRQAAREAAPDGMDLGYDPYAEPLEPKRKWWAKKNEDDDYTY